MHMDNLAKKKMLGVLDVFTEGVSNKQKTKGRHKGATRMAAFFVRAQLGVVCEGGVRGCLPQAP